MPTKSQTGAIALIAIMTFIVALASSGWPVSWVGWLRPVTMSFTVTGLSVWLFHVFLWKWSPEFLAPRPNINGTWRVTAETWSGPGATPAAGASSGGFKGYMVARQDYFSLSLRLLTKDTQSELVAEQFTVTKAGAYQLWAIYFCEGRPNRPPSAMVPHYGAIRLEVTGHGENMRLVGCYWVNGSMPDGSLTLDARKPYRFDDFESAEAAFTMAPIT